MATYNDLFFRTNLQATGDVPQPQPPSSCPDIIPYGTTPVADPQTFFSGNYNQDVGQNVLLNELNYIYLRTQNLAAAAATGQISVYFSPASLLLWPSMWMTNILKTSSGATSVSVTAASTGSVAVTTDPFLWTPSAPASGDHYCMISQVTTAAHPNILPPNPPITTGDELAAFVCNNPQIGWRNVVTVNDPNQPLWQISVNYTQGLVGGYVYVFLQCTDVAVGMSVGFECATPGPSPLISMPPTLITNPVTQTLGIYTNIPANFVSNITYSLWTNGVQDIGGQVVLQAVVILPPGHELHAKGRPLHEFGVSEELQAQIGPSTGVVVGSHSMVSSAANL